MFYSICRLSTEQNFAEICIPTRPLTLGLSATDVVGHGVAWGNPSSPPPPWQGWCSGAPLAVPFAPPLTKQDPKHPALVLAAEAGTQRWGGPAGVSWCLTRLRAPLRLRPAKCLFCVLLQFWCWVGSMVCCMLEKLFVLQKIRIAQSVLQKLKPEPCCSIHFAKGSPSRWESVIRGIHLRGGRHRPGNKHIKHNATSHAHPHQYA